MKCKLKFKKIIFGLAALLLFSGCSSENKEEYGNTSGNIVNAGIAASDGENIFFYSNGKICKMKNDGSQRTEVLEDSALYFNIYDNEVYYVSIGNDPGIYKLKKDGSGKEKVFDDGYCEYMTLYDDKIFFETTDTKSYYGTYSPYFVELGENEKINLSSADIENIYPDGEYIYFSNWDDNAKLYKVNIKTKESTAITENGCSYINITENYIYYRDVEDEKIYKVKKDGTDSSAVCDDKTIYINVSDDYIYYSNVNDNGYIYKIKTDGTEKQKLNDIESSCINIVGDWIFYTGSSDGIIYKMKTDGSMNDAA